MEASLRKAIRAAYKEYLPIILKRYPNRIDPYIFDFDVPLTPIEQNVWTDIRYIGLPFFMQVPVAGYFIDFADPVKKIGIEVDGKEWHMNVKKDQERENELVALGWTIYRIPGRVTFKTQQDYEDHSGNIDPNFYYECSEGILRRIEKKHYRKYPQFAGSLTL